MVEPYNLTLLGQADGWVGYMLVFNYWTNSVYFTGLCLVMFMIMFAVAKYNLVPTPEALTTASFVCFLMSSLFWIFTYAGVHAVSTFIPIMFLFATGWGVYYIRSNS